MNTKNLKLACSPRCVVLCGNLIGAEKFMHLCSRKKSNWNIAASHKSKRGVIGRMNAGLINDPIISITFHPSRFLFTHQSSALVSRSVIVTSQELLSECDVSMFEWKFIAHLICHRVCKSAPFVSLGTSVVGSRCSHLR